MKKIFSLICVSAVLSLSSCGYQTPSGATPELFTEQEQVSSTCGQCNGSGVIYSYYGPQKCFVCNGNGVNISFRARQAYYAECAHHSGCKLFVAEHSGSTTCKCGCSKFAHVKRYY